jgi:hypothetical protein
MSDAGKKIAAIAVALVLGAAAGRFAGPTKVVTKTEIKEVVKEVEKKTSETNKRNDKVVIVVETVLPDGTRRKETKIVDRGTITIDASSSSETDRTTETKTEKVVERARDGVIVYGLAGARLSDWTSGPEYGGGVQARVLGPFWLGAYGTTKTSVGLTLGVSF